MKSNLKNSVYGAIGFIIPVVVALATTPYIVHKLTPEIYGIYVLSTSLMGLMSFLDLGFGQGIIKFVSEYEAKKDYEGIRNVIGVSFYIYLVMGLLGAIVIFIFSDKLTLLFKVNENYKDLARYVFHLASLGFLVNFLTNIFAPIPNALQRYDISTKIQTLIWLVSTLSIVYVLSFGFGLKEVIIISLVFGIIKMIVCLYVSKKMLPTIPLRPAFNAGVFKKIFSFSFFTAVNSITGNLVFRVDKMIISSFLGTAAVTYYSVPFMMIQIGANFISSATQFIFPAISSMSSLGLKEELRQLYKKVVRYTLAISVIITLGFIILGNSFLTLWMGADFAKNSEKIVPIIAMVFFFQAISVPAFHTYNGLGFSRINMISSFIGSTAYLLAAMILIPAFKLTGAAISFAFTLLPFPFYFYYLHRVIEIGSSYFSNLLLKSLITMFIVYTGFFLFHKIIIIQPSIPSLVISGILLIIFSSAIIFLFRLIRKEELLSLASRVKRSVV